ncbi:MAG: bifunctional DNA-formamidopyrimidine glycosylase/DNA-(apurinic or apyrimidinic site) lyase [Pseudomonadota bacterium]|nr:bifunctional DNA-formamidopyrimidine glycosylase/DNA-(apurinic or apyrimidinic site) lyase [Pseudomonadota bacterium]
MPELPEVETTCRGISPHSKHQIISNIEVRNFSLRWPIPKQISNITSGQTIQDISRRAKYILMKLETGTMIMHLGMSGRLHVLKSKVLPEKHDHVDINLGNGVCLRYNDVRRFGSIHWTEECPQQHFLIKNLGVEPLTDEYNHEFLLKKCKQRKTNIKQLLMNHNIVVGIGNIYASETLFLARVHPERAASSITVDEAKRIVEFSKDRLTVAIESGGTTLKDFLSSDGKPGYFQNKLNVYGRTGEECNVCGNTIKKIIQGQRATFFCDQCQK